MKQTPAATAVLTVLALIAFAANSLLCRLALGEFTIDPASYTAIRLISGALALWLIAIGRRQGRKAKPAGSWFSAALLFAYAVTFSFAYISLSTGTGALILFAAVQITMIATGLRAGERPQPMEWLGLCLASVGLIYLVLPGVTAPSPLGSLLMVSAGIAWGCYSLRGRRINDPIGATAGNFLLTVPFALVVLLLWYSSLSVSGAGVFWAGLSGSISSGVGYVLWYAALRGLTATRAATVQLAVPVIAALAGVIFLSELVTPRLLIASVAILGGVGMAVWRHQDAAQRQGESADNSNAVEVRQE